MANNNHLKTTERILKALANKRRLAILVYLKKCTEATVGNIAEAIRLSFKSTSRHLSVLASADITDKEQRGLEVHYRLSPATHPMAKQIISNI